MVTYEFEWKFTPRSEACQDSKVQKECLKERLQKMADWEKGRKLERETKVCTVY